MHRRLGAWVVLGAALAAVVGCAEQQDPINRVEANALPKSLFTGEWYYQQTVVDVPGTYTATMVGNTNYNGMHRVRWDVQEKYLYARKAYEHNIGTKQISEDTGEYLGAIVGAWRIEDHFDIRRGYNPQTGEENNVLEENASDCIWHECKYMRVDWSQNMALDYMFLSGDEKSGELGKEPVPFYNQDADPRWKPIFDATAGYIDVTTSMAVDPGYKEFPEWGASYPLCWLFAYSHAECNTQIIKIRNSFMRREFNRDYEPREHKAPEDEWYGFFRQERFEWENHYTLNYRTRQKVINRHNLWIDHHYMTDKDIKCTQDAECTAKYGADSRCDRMVPFHQYDTETDTDGDGLADAFEKTVSGLDENITDTDGDGVSDKNDDADGNGTRDIEDQWLWDRKSLHYRCTIPLAQRDTPRPVAYFNTGFFPRDLVCDKDDTGTGPCKPWTFSADDATRRKNYSALHYINDDYDDLFWKIFLRGSWGWSETDYQKWIRNKKDISAFSAEQQKQLALFGDKDNGYYAFAMCQNNPIDEKAPWPCRFNHYSFAQAKELMKAGIKYTDLPYRVAKKLLDDGKKADIEKRGKPFIRHGDIRTSQVNWVKDYYDGWALLGLGPSHTDPRTGENLAGVANVYALNDWAATRVQEMVQLLNGDISSNDYINGVNLDNWIAKTKSASNMVQRGRDSVTMDQLKTIYGHMVQPWMAKIPKAGSPQLLSQWIDQMSQKQIRNKLLQRTAAAGLFQAGKRPVDITAIKGTPLERRMIDSDLLLAAGYAPASVKNLTKSVLDRTSPARGGMFKFLNAQQEWRFNLANKRNMYFASMADDAMVGLAWRMAQKYKDLSPAERAQKVWYEARDTIMRAVLTHEMGHTFGLHHNWGGSQDVMNFKEGYWQLRTNNWKDQKICTNPSGATANDGQLCPFFVKNKEMTDLQLGKSQTNLSQNLDSMYEYSYSSLMDYAGKYTIDGRGLGRYDIAAILFGHADKMEVFKDTGSVPIGRPTDSNRVNLFEEWSSRDADILVFTAQGPSSYHYTNWWGQLGKKLVDESNRELVDYRKITEYCYSRETGGSQKAAVPCSQIKPENQRSVGYFYPNGNKKQVRVPYVFCTYTRGDISDGCNTRDYGADQYERMKAHVDNWDTWTLMRQFTRYQFPWDASEYVGRNYGRTYKVLKNFNNSFSLYQGLFRQWFPESMVQNFFTDPIFGWGAYTKAMHDGFNMAMHTLAMPDIKQFEKGTWADGSTVYKEAEYRVDFRSDLSNARHFATSWWDTNNQDSCGLSFWECLHHVGFYLDKMMALEVLSDPVTYFVARDTAEDIREWRISFFDNFTSQIVDFFGAMLSEDFQKFSPYYDPSLATSKLKVDKNGNEWVNGMAWRNYAAPTMDIAPAATAAPVEASTRFTLQIYALVFGMMEMHQNFDNEFVARGRMWKKGSKNTLTITPNKKIEGLVEYTDPWSGQTYVGVGYKDKRGIAQKMLLHANKIKSRTSYCTPKTTPPPAVTPLDQCADNVSATDKTSAEAALYDYSQLMDILVQLTAMYDNNGQNWSDDYEDP